MLQLSAASKCGCLNELQDGPKCRLACPHWPSRQQQEVSPTLTATGEPPSASLAAGGSRASAVLPYAGVCLRETGKWILICKQKRKESEFPPETRPCWLLSASSSMLKAVLKPFSVPASLQRHFMGRDCRIFLNSSWKLKKNCYKPLFFSHFISLALFLYMKLLDFMAFH